MEKENKGRAIALLPIGVFLIIFLGAGIVFEDFYAMPAIVAFLIALFVAFLQNKELSFNKKIEVIAKGVGEENIITMSLIFLCAGGFSGAVTAAGGVDSTVNLGLSLIPAHFAVAGLFLIGCFISVSMGTSMGTIAALAPIAVGITCFQCSYPLFLLSQLNTKFFQTGKNAIHCCCDLSFFQCLILCTEYDRISN